MTQDPWSRPTIDDLRRVLESIGKPNVSNVRANERLELSVRQKFALIEATRSPL